MTLDNMTKEELKVWGMVKTGLAEDQARVDVIDEQDGASRAEAAAAAAVAKSRRKIGELLDAKPGTSAITFRSLNEDKDAEPA